MFDKKESKNIVSKVEASKEKKEKEIPLEKVDVRKFSRFDAIITRKFVNTRMVVKRAHVKTNVLFFQVKGFGTFYADFENVQRVEKKPEIVYDVNYCESVTYKEKEVELDPETGRPKVDPITGKLLYKEVQKTLDGVHVPVKVDEEIHFSNDVDMLLKGKAIEQALGSLDAKPKSNDNWILLTIIAIISGLMGYAFGNIMPITHQTTVVPIPAGTTTITQAGTTVYTTVVHTATTMIRAALELARGL